MTMNGIWFFCGVFVVTWLEQQQQHGQVTHVYGFTGGFVGGQHPYNKCTKEEYWSDFIANYGATVTSRWTIGNVVKLITDSHRNVLDNVAPIENGDDINMALKDLWNVPNEDNRIHLIYTDQPARADIANTQLGWEKDDLWPRGRGWNAPGDKAPWTDIYGKAPARATSVSARRKLFFGTCGTVEDPLKCRTPATSETANTTATDRKIWTPPVTQRGAVARSLFYFAARYANEYGLKLDDCPPFANNEYGYLSELLRWHLEYPVSDKERNRNDRGCERWQGNRNPFVDYPELVTLLFYPDGPDENIPSAFKYARCSAPTSAPTATPNTCSELEPGDIPIFLYNSLDPDQVVLFPLVDLDPSIGSLYLTDNAWDGTKLLTTEGTMEFVIPAEGMKAGDVFGFGSDGGTDKTPWSEQWTQLRGAAWGNSFDLNTQQGDNLFLYCLNADSIPHFIYGYTNAGGWITGGLTPEDYGIAFSALPTQLDNAGSIYMDNKNADNCVYQGPTRNIPKAQLAAFFLDPVYYDCVDQPRIALDVPGLSGSVATSIMAITTTMTVILLGLTLLFW